MRDRKKVHDAPEMFVEKTFKSTTKGADALKMEGISRPHENDVLMGRGGKNNQHSGNEKLREIARDRVQAYCSASKKGKSEISRELVGVVRSLTPPGRFLRKNAETCKWEDVGEEIAREKTSQVLRDAVSILIGPISKVGIKQKETDESERKSSKVKRGNHSQSEGYDGQRELQASGRRPRPLELRSGQTRKLNHPYYSNFCVQNQVDRGETGNATPYQYLPVTPASTIALAKRPRYHESPLAVPESQSRRNVMAITTPIPSAYQPYPHQSPYSSMSTSSSPASMFLSPPQRPIIQRQSSFAYFSGPSHHNSMTSSPDILAPTRGASHFVPPSGQFREPCLEDVPQFGNDFDLFHEELLSDHSDRGDREVSISPYPLLQCFSNADRNEQSGEPYFGNDL